VAQDATLRVEGYRELLRAFQQADREQRLALRHTLRDIGAVVQRDAVRRLSPIDARSAAGYKVRVRQRGVAVEQSLGRTTGAHPEWGSYQMRHALLPALYANEHVTEIEMEQALDLVAAKFNRGGVV
jgi:hypothetical protein